MSTRQQYTAQVRWFAEFCVAACCDQCVEWPTQQFMTYALPVPIGARVHCGAILKGLKDACRAHGYLEIVGPEPWPDLHRTPKGTQQLDKTTVSKKQPTTPEMLMHFRGSIDWPDGG